MRNALSIARRIVTQMANDRRTIGLIFIAPLAMVTLIWVVINGGLTRPAIAVTGDAPAGLLAELSKNAEVVAAADAGEGLALVRDLAVDALLDYGESPPRLTVDGADPSVTVVVAQAVQKAAFSFLSSSPLRALVGNLKPEIVLLHGTADATAFDFVAPVMMAFVIFFFIFILAAIALLRERTTGTLARILVSPATPTQLVAGYMLGFGAFAVVQTVLIQVYTIQVLGIPARGSFLEILAVNLALCWVALSMGSFASAFAQNEFQVMQFIPIIVLPQILFSGIIDLRQAPGWVQVLSKIFPLTYAGNAQRGIMLRGEGLGQNLGNLGIVLAFAALFMLLNVLMIRRPRA